MLHECKPSLEFKEVRASYTTDGFKEVGEPVKLGQGVGVAMRKRDEELAQEVNEALATLKEDGTYNTIMDKYFAYDIKM